MLVKVKRFGRVLMAGVGFLYDLHRFARYSGWRSSLKSKEVRNYYMVKVAHALEKSMSFSNRRPGAGWANAEMLTSALEESMAYRDFGCHDLASLTVLKKFVDLEKGISPERSMALSVRLKAIEDKCPELVGGCDNAGVFTLTKEDFSRGVLIRPEDFFLSRYSLREYSDEPVAPGSIDRALRLAMKSPSVCNRQAWHVYHLNGDLAQKALSFQDGNRGFGDKLKDVLIVTVDLRAFVSSRERYQHWIDGGMFSMSLIWALHSLGIASCCLNWSQSALVDIKLRSAVAIRPEHTVMMMLAIGYPKETNFVCTSSRRPVDEVYTRL